jgi:hypothetical protein
MSRTNQPGERRVRVRPIRKSPPDLRRLARALIALVEAEAEADAEAEAEALELRRQGRNPKSPPADPKPGEPA